MHPNVKSYRGHLYGAAARDKRVNHSKERSRRFSLRVHVSARPVPSPTLHRRAGPNPGVQTITVTVVRHGQPLSVMVTVLRVDLYGTQEDRGRYPGRRKLFQIRRVAAKLQKMCGFGKTT